MARVLRAAGPRGLLLSVCLILCVPPGVRASSQTTPSGPDTPQVADYGAFPEVVARVNGSAIGKQELLSRVKAVQSGMGLPSGDIPLGVYRMILDELVDGELLYQASRTLDLQAGTDEVDRQYQELRSSFPSQEAFQAQLAGQSVSEERLKELLQKDLSIQKLIETELIPQVSVSSEAKRSFYADNLEKMEQPEELRIGHILARTDPEASEDDRERARQRIAAFREDIIQRGADFSAMAREHSDDLASKEDGGELTIRRGQTLPAFEEAAFSLETGAVSDVIETRFGYHIVKLHERIPARQASYEDVEEIIQQYLQEQGLQQVIKAEVKELRSQASIEVFI